MRVHGLQRHRDYGEAPEQTAPIQIDRQVRVLVLPNPSLKLTRYGRHCKPGMSHSYYRLRPGLQYLPPRAA